MNYNKKKKLPIVYFQIKKIKEFWEKSTTENKEEFIQIFEDKLKEIEREYLFEV